MFYCNCEKVKAGQYYDTEVLISVIVILGVEMCPTSPDGYNATKAQERHLSEVPSKHEVSCQDETSLYGKLIYLLGSSEVNPLIVLKLPSYFYAFPQSLVP